MSFKDYFTKGTKQAKIKNALLIISFALTAYLGSYLLSIPPHIMIDFPCFVEVENGYAKERFYDADMTKDVWLLVTTSPAFSSGGGCYYKYLNNGESTEMNGYSIKVEGSNIVVDGKTLKPGDKWRVEKVENDAVNPWWQYKNYFSLKNEGLVKGEKDIDGNTTNFEKNILVVTGSSGSIEDFNLATAAIFLASIIVFAVLAIGSAYYFVKK